MLKFLRQYRHLDRYREIIRIVARHGFWPLFRPNKSWSEKAKDPELPDRIRLLLQDLGPTFIKLGQMLSTRPDLVPPAFTASLARLQDEVQPVSREEIYHQIEAELGQPPDQIFARFEDRCLASASIAQVHYARLASGEEVAVKIQKPGLPELATKDLAIMEQLARLIKKHTPLSRVCDPEEVLEVFRRHMRRELDFTVEALNMETFARIFTAHEGIVVPKVYWPLTAKKILTMEYIRGVRVGEIDQLAGSDRLSLARSFTRAVFRPFYQEGIFHADPHPGNVLFLAGNRVALLDYGIIGRMPPEFRHQMAELILAIIENDVLAVVESTKKFGRVTGKVNEEYLYEDVAELIDQVVAAGDGEIQLGRIITGMINLSLRHGIKMPGSFFTLGKSIMNAEALAQKVNPGYDLMSAARELAIEYLRVEIKPRIKSEHLYRQANNVFRMLMNLPCDVHQAIQSLARGELRIVFWHRNLNWLHDMIELAASRLSFSLIISAIIVGSAIVMHSNRGPLILGFPVFGLIGYLGALVMGSWMLAILLRSGGLR